MDRCRHENAEVDSGMIIFTLSSAWRLPCGRLGGSSLIRAKRLPCGVELLYVSRLRKDLKDNKNAMLITTPLYLIEKAVIPP